MRDELEKEFFENSKKTFIACLDFVMDKNRQLMHSDDFHPKRLVNLSEIEQVRLCNEYHAVQYFCNWFRKSDTFVKISYKAYC